MFAKKYQTKKNIKLNNSLFYRTKIGFYIEKKNRSKLNMLNNSVSYRKNGVVYE